MCDVFLVLAQAPGGLSCFLVPRVLPDGTRNTFLIQRLKDKLGNRSNASGEIEFDDTSAAGRRRGRAASGRSSRWSARRGSTASSAARGMRAGGGAGAAPRRDRSAFGRRLVEQPLMRNVLADLPSSRRRRSSLIDAPRAPRRSDAGESAFGRLANAVGEVLGVQADAGVVAEALECLGGNGYVEEAGCPAVPRDAAQRHLGGVGNVIALDVLRAVQRDPASVTAVAVRTRHNSRRGSPGSTRPWQSFAGDLTILVRAVRTTNAGRAASPACSLGAYRAVCSFVTHRSRVAERFAEALFCG